MKTLIKKETISKIEEEINQKITLPNNLKENVKKDVFTNIIIAISMIVYFTFLIMGSVGTVKSVRIVDFNIFSILLLSVSIYLFEIAYKKDNGTLAIYGVETLVVSIITLFFPYIIFELDEFSKKYYMIVSAYIAVYYIIKSIWIVSKAKKIHIKQASDIKEIVKKEKRKSNIKEDVEEIKTTREERKEQKETSKEEPVEINNEDNQNVGVALQGDPKPKKRGRPKKTDVENKEETEPQREPTKKSETTNNENQNNAHTVTQSEQKPKKRGRPKKTVETDVSKEPQTEQIKKVKKQRMKTN